MGYGFMSEMWKCESLVMLIGKNGGKVVIDVYDCTGWEVFHQCSARFVRKRVCYS